MTIIVKVVKYNNMSNKKYKKICQDLLSDMSDRQREVLVRRFGLDSGEKETLDSIGKDFGVCRERVRQIQSSALNKIKPKAKQYKEVFQSFSKYFKTHGGLRKEDALLNELGGEEKNEVHFLLNLSDQFRRINEKDDMHALWVSDQKFFESAKAVISSLQAQLAKSKKSISINQFKSPLNLNEKALTSYVGVSKTIGHNGDGLYGLADWPEINPRGVKDKAYLAFKKEGRPLHFRDLAKLLDGTHEQTLHNELIKDDRFVLVGRGTYALAEWGYYPGQVRDVITKILTDANKPLSREEVVEKVLGHRLVKENTILLNLSNKKYFQRNGEGLYGLKEI